METSAAPLRITVATANIAGGARQEKADPCKYKLLGNLLAEQERVDILGLQEVIRVEDPDTGEVLRDDIALLKVQSGLAAYDHFFFPELNSLLLPHPTKWESTLFKEWTQKGYRIQEGSAILVSNRHRFWHLLHDDRPGSGSGQVMPWYVGNKPTFFGGNRDTGPRTLLMARVRIGGRFVLFCCTHLSTLKEEDPKEGGRQFTPAAIALRTEQTEWIASYVNDYRRTPIDGSVKKDESVWRDDPIVLAGDFNTDTNADVPVRELLPLTALGLDVSRVPLSSAVSFSHRKHKVLVDRVFAGTNAIESLRVLDLEQLETSSDRTISDHHPVVAELIL